MGDNLVPNGLSIGCKVILLQALLQVNAERHSIWVRYGRDAFLAWPLLLGPRFRRQPRAARAAPLRASGVDGSARPSNWLSMPRMQESASCIRASPSYRRHG